MSPGGVGRVGMDAVELELTRNLAANRWISWDLSPLEHTHSGPNKGRHTAGHAQS